MARRSAEPLDATLAELQERYGADNYQRRRRLEQQRIREYYQPLSRRMTAFKVRILRPLLTWSLRLLGLYQRGYQQVHAIELRENRLALTNLPQPFDGYTILQLSDLHLDIDPGLVDSIITAVTGLDYDLCVLTGDFRNATVGEWRTVIEPMQRLMGRLKGPVYAVPGNHDFLEMVPPLEQLGLRFLLNESVVLERSGTRVHLIGIDDPNIYATHDLPRALRQVPCGGVTLLLSHSPTIYREAATHGIDVVLAGHTHGGQICLPGGKILVRNDKSPRRLLRGAWRYQTTLGYTSAGTGSGGIPVRFNCPPEVTLHRLERSAQC